MSRVISASSDWTSKKSTFSDVIKQAIASVRPSADAKEIRFQVVLDPLAGSVRGDPGRLQQCFWNLLSNAIKFTPKRGIVQWALSA